MNDENGKTQKDFLKYSVEQFDKNVTYIAAGAFSIAFAFIDNIVKDIKNAQCKGLLITSLSLFALVIFVSLVAHFISMKAHHWAVAHQQLEAVDFNEKIKKWNKPIAWMNISMIILILIAAIFLITFIYINL